MNSDSDVQVHIRNELRMCKIDCRKCKFVCLHVCSGSATTAREMDLRQIRYDFRKPFKCKVCDFVVEHRECQTFGFIKNSVIEFPCERCNFFCNHTCSSAYDRHEVTSEVIRKGANDMWYLRIVCGNTMSLFKHTCGTRHLTWADECSKKRLKDQSSSDCSSLYRGRLMDHSSKIRLSYKSYECHRNHCDTERCYRRQSIGQNYRASNEGNNRHCLRYNRLVNDHYCGKRDCWTSRTHQRRPSDPLDSSEHDHCCYSRLQPSPSTRSRRARRD